MSKSTDRLTFSSVRSSLVYKTLSTVHNNPPSSVTHADPPHLEHFSFPLWRSTEERPFKFTTRSKSGQCRHSDVNRRWTRASRAARRPTKALKRLTERFMLVFQSSGFLSREVRLGDEEEEDGCFPTGRLQRALRFLHYTALITRPAHMSSTRRALCKCI